MKRFGIPLIVVLIVIFVALIAIIIRNSQTYSTTRKVIDQKEYSVVENKTTEEVEQENLAKLVEKNRSDTINKYKYSDSELVIPENKLTSINYYKINPDGTITSTRDSVDPTTTIASIYTDAKISDQKDVIKNLSTLLSQDKFLNIELDKNLEQYLPDFFTFIKDLSTFTKANSIKITYSTYPYWGNTIDYSYFYGYTSLYSDHMDASLMIDYVDYIRIHTYFYTNPKSILAGPLSPLNWVENTVRYFLLKNIDSKKLQIVINTKALKWDYVDYEENYKRNFIDTEDNATIQTQTQIAELIEQKINSQVNFDNGEVLYYLSDGKTLVTPTQITFKNLEELAKDYSLDGVVYK